MYGHNKYGLVYCNLYRDNCQNTMLIDSPGNYIYTYGNALAPTAISTPQAPIGY